MQSVYNYQRVVLNAFTEVINYITAVENYGQSIQIKKQQLQALETSVDVATNLFQNARAEYIDVLLAQRGLMEARMVLVETKQQQLAAVVNAYQALGGGGAPAVSSGLPVIDAAEEILPVLDPDDVEQIEVEKNEAESSSRKSRWFRDKQNGDESAAPAQNQVEAIDSH